MDPASFLWPRLPDTLVCPGGRGYRGRGVGIPPCSGAERPSSRRPEPEDLGRWSPSSSPPGAPRAPHGCSCIFLTRKRRDLRFFSQASSWRSAPSNQEEKARSPCPHVQEWLRLGLGLGGSCHLGLLVPSLPSRCTSVTNVVIGLVLGKMLPPPPRCWVRGVSRPPPERPEERSIVAGLSWLWLGRHVAGAEKWGS